MSNTTQEFRLTRLGLKQEFRREFDFLASFGLSFIVQSPLLGVSIGLTYAWQTGGPASASWGWVIVSVGSMFVGLSMAEIVSALPASGGPFFWSSWLGGTQGPVLSFVTGWLNMFGQLALSTGNAISAVSSVAAIVSMTTGNPLSGAHQLLLQLGILVLGGAVNICQPRTVARFLALGIFVNFVGVIFVVLLLPAVAPWRQSPKFVFTTFFDKSLSPNEVPSNTYLWFQALCMGLFTIAGYDCCSHITEETKGADVLTPLAIIYSIAASAILGYVLLLGLLFCVQDKDPWALLNPDNQAHGFVAGQLVWDMFAARFGTGAGSASVLCICAVSGIMCTAASLTSNSRCLFAFARSRAVPFSSFCKHVQPGHRLDCAGLDPRILGGSVSTRNLSSGD
ncbi:hypothetical protein WJX73_006386 [Symbiochloris irregularis]|uniref:Amino acid transporter n=1 Tax=Symbiochloris irregularis TaxID=706552 RepID=A0AAW1NZ62_9CHLO